MAAILVIVGEVSDQHGGPSAFREFAARSFTALVAVLLRTVRDPALAFDLATETLATAHLRWEFAPPEEDLAMAWLLRLGADVLTETSSRGRVPATERRRTSQSATRVLSVAEQREITRLAERHVDLPNSARRAADELARMAPPPHVLKTLALSSLVTAEPLPDHDRHRDGA
jgi:DNA-directed RNA polymerase specialized sigma24 family protein